jgi:hypothetical protein
MLQPELLKKVIELLDANDIDYMVTGSLVSSMQGEPRATHDVDIVVNITSSAIPVLINAFPLPGYYISAPAIEDAIRTKSMFNLLDTSEGDKVDFWMLTNEPFDQSRFKRKVPERMLGLPMKVSSPEDTILMKLRWSELSGGSEKQYIDAMRVYEIQFSNLDKSYLEFWADNLRLRDIWDRLKSEADPLNY